MLIKYFTSIRGIRQYHVLMNQEDIFTGTLGECKRFIVIRNDKIRSRRRMEDAERARLVG